MIVKCTTGHLLHRRRDLFWQSTQAAACSSPFGIWSHLKARLLRGAILARHPPFFAVSAGSLASAGSLRSTLLYTRAMFCGTEIISSPPQGNWRIFGPISWDTTPAMLSFPSASSHTTTLCHHLFFAVLFSVLHQLVALTSAWSTLSSTGCPGSLSLLPLKILSCLSTSPPMLLPPVSQQTVGGRSVVFFFYSWGWRTPYGVHQTFY